ncbi:hypothetical protein WH47_01116 [Habropoda laboriosa]|uniref:Uncharacterized protein n=1 Tax=Habropoda laboriosa TaxID=597456 RepID=A0A0L7QYZ3_9HYME|nr:hypothetical protein WH47_01116 [Habropoda laboriosa]
MIVTCEGQAAHRRNCKKHSAYNTGNFSTTHDISRKCWVNAVQVLSLFTSQYNG